MTPFEKTAEKALKSLLNLTRNSQAVAWYLGHGTQTRALALEAMAALSGRTVEDLEKSYPVHPEPKNPAENRPAEEPTCRGGEEPLYPDLASLLSALDRRCTDNAGRMATAVERMELEALWREAGGVS